MQIQSFQEIETCILSDAAPSQQLRSFSEAPWFGTFPFSMLLAEKNTEQSPTHHPEGNVWEHTLLVVDEAAKRKEYSTNPRVFMWAALLHDIGKPETTKIRKGRITSYDHDKKGAELARSFLSKLTDEVDFIQTVGWLVRFHMHILYVTKSLPFADVPGMRAHTDLRDTALLGYCDRLGRTGADCQAERNAIITFLQKCHEKTDLPWLSC